MNTDAPIAMERHGANIDAPDAYYGAAHVRVIGERVLIYNAAGDVFAEYDFDETPATKAGGKLVGTVGGAPLVVDKGCGCRNKPFTVTPKGDGGQDG